MEKILIILIGIILCYCLDETLFYHTEKKYCKKYKGNCDFCDCWSCKKKQIELKKEKEKWS